MDINAVKRDHKAVAAGVWVSDIPEMGAVRLRVRGLSAPDVVAVRARKERAATRDEKERDGRLKPEASARIFSEVLFEKVLLDWDGLTDKGEPVPYSPEMAQLLLTDPDYRMFADAVAWAAMAVDRGEAERAEEASKN